MTASYIYGLYIDEVLSVTHAGSGGSGDTTHYFHYDDLYNTTAITNAAGQVLERYAYNDVGQPLFFAPDQTPRPASAIGTTRLWNGREYDTETGLYYYRTRYLDPATGRFTTRDTIGIWGDPMNMGNGYTYVGNSPWTLLDPHGMGDWREQAKKDRDAFKQYTKQFVQPRDSSAVKWTPSTPPPTSIGGQSYAPEWMRATFPSITRALPQTIARWNHIIVSSMPFRLMRSGTAWCTRTTEITTARLGKLGWGRWAPITLSGSSTA